MKEYSSSQDYTALFASMGVTHSFPKLTEDYTNLFPI